jgi:HEPN domain-containing protein
VADQQWQVRIALDPEEAEAIVVAMLRIAPREQWAMGMPVGDAFSILSIESDAQSPEGAKAEAIDLYGSAREQARLPVSEAQILGVFSPMPAAAPHDRLLDEAEALAEERNFDLAVVRAQTACEVYAPLALDRMARDEAEGRSFRKVTLSDREDRVLLRALTGIEIGGQPWWQGYRRHLDLRNDIAHKGLHASKDQAAESIDAARAFIGFLKEWWMDRARRG